MCPEKPELRPHDIEPALRVDGISMLDGYLTAIVIGPCPIPPDERFVDLLGVNGYSGSASGKRPAAIPAMAAPAQAALIATITLRDVLAAPTFHRWRQFRSWAQINDDDVSLLASIRRRFPWLRHVFADETSIAGAGAYAPRNYPIWTVSVIDYQGR